MIDFSLSNNFLKYVRNKWGANSHLENFKEQPFYTLLPAVGHYATLLAQKA
jgi:hypothetical protein